MDFFTTETRAPVAKKTKKSSTSEATEEEDQEDEDKEDKSNTDNGELYSHLYLGWKIVTYLVKYNWIWIALLGSLRN